MFARIQRSTNGGSTWDTDGSGVGAAVTIATLTNKPTLSAADFVLV